MITKSPKLVKHSKEKRDLLLEIGFSLLCGMLEFEEALRSSQVRYKIEGNNYRDVRTESMQFSIIKNSV